MATQKHTRGYLFPEIFLCGMKVKFGLFKFKKTIYNTNQRYSLAIIKAVSGQLLLDIVVAYITTTKYGLMKAGKGCGLLRFYKTERTYLWFLNTEF